MRKKKKNESKQEARKTFKRKETNQGREDTNEEKTDEKKKSKDLGSENRPSTDSYTDSVFFQPCQYKCMRSCQLQRNLAS